MNIHKKGFTLIEILITLGLAGVISVVLLSVLIYGFRASDKISDSSLLNQDIQLGVIVMRDLLEETKGISLVNDSSPSSSEVIVQNFTIVDKEDNTLKYHMDNNRLLNTNNKVLINNLEVLKFKVNDTDVVVNMKFNKDSTTKGIESIIIFRNK